MDRRKVDGMAKSKVTVRSGAVLWAAFLVLGVLIWLASAGAWSNQVYTLVLMVVVFSWFGYVVRDRAPKSN
jgi:hypothetical protein